MRLYWLSSECVRFTVTEVNIWCSSTDLKQYSIFYIYMCRSIKKQSQTLRGNNPPSSALPKSIRGGPFPRCGLQTNNTHHCRTETGVMRPPNEWSLTAETGVMLSGLASASVARYTMLRCRICWYLRGRRGRKSDWFQAVDTETEFWFWLTEHTPPRVLSAYIQWCTVLTGHSRPTAATAHKQMSVSVSWRRKRPEVRGFHGSLCLRVVL